MYYDRLKESPDFKRDLSTTPERPNVWRLSGGRSPSVSKRLLGRNPGASNPSALLFR
jgi:hypothetical protein